jgi:hypothetical protein
MLIPFGILSAAVAGPISLGVAGYAAGGLATVLVTTVDKFAFPSDTRSTLGTGLSIARRAGAGVSNSGVAGYSAQGFTTSNSDRIDKFAFPSDTRSTLTSVSAKRAPGGFSNSGVAGYLAGGIGALRTTSVQKLVFATDTDSDLGTGLSSNRASGCGFSNNTVAGYHAGGGPDGSENGVTTVDKFAFSNDSRTTLGTGLSSARRGLAGFSNQAVAGYSAGGATSSPASSHGVATVDKFAFPSDTRSTLGTGLSSGRSFGAGFSNREIAGFVGGGLTTVTVDTVDKFAFPSDTRSTLGTGLSSSREEASGFADEGVF